MRKRRKSFNFNADTLYHSRTLKYADACLLMYRIYAYFLSKMNYTKYMVYILQINQTNDYFFEYYVLQYIILLKLLESFRNFLG